MSTDQERENFIRSYLKPEEITRLVAEAKKASEIASAPYSKFNVGVCILTHEGDYIFGCNIENISYTQTIHAEGCAISKAIAEQKRNFKAISVYAKSENFDSFVPPCGECRQFLAEFVNFLPVIMVHETGALMYEMLHELLPLSMVLGSTAPQKGGQTFKYDQTVMKANGWILRDTYGPTRNEMRRLLREWKFDEIEELTKERLSFKEDGVISAKFRAGPASVNYLTVQEIIEGFCQALKDANYSVYVDYKGDELVTSIAHRIVASVKSYGRVTIENGDRLKGNEGTYGVKISCSGDGDEKKYEIKFVDANGVNVKKELCGKIIEKREELKCLKFLMNDYDYQKNRLLDEQSFRA